MSGQTIKAKAKPHAAAVAGGGSLGVTLAYYLNSQFNWGFDPDSEVLLAIAALFSAGIGYAVHQLQKKFPVLVNVLESATGKDIDGDGDVGK